MLTLLALSFSLLSNSSATSIGCSAGYTLIADPKSPEGVACVAIAARLKSEAAKCAKGAWRACQEVCSLENQQAPRDQTPKDCRVIAETRCRTKKDPVACKEILDTLEYELRSEFWRADAAMVTRLHELRKICGNACESEVKSTEVFCSSDRSDTACLTYYKTERIQGDANRAEQFYKERFAPLEALCQRDARACFALSKLAQDNRQFKTACASASADHPRKSTFCLLAKRGTERRYSGPCDADRAKFCVGAFAGKGMPCLLHFRKQLSPDCASAAKEDLDDYAERLENAKGAEAR